MIDGLGGIEDVEDVKAKAAEKVGAYRDARALRGSTGPGRTPPWV